MLFTFRLSSPAEKLAELASHVNVSSSAAAADVP
jgi:hypothetical protein